jgi:hypothetical protein
MSNIEEPLDIAISASPNLESRHGSRLPEERIERRHSRAVQYPEARSADRERVRPEGTRTSPVRPERSDGPGAQAEGSADAIGRRPIAWRR